MVAEAKTEIVVNYDCDVLLPLDSYHEAYQSILHHTHDVIYPIWTRNISEASKSN
jgi:hypothetical protein